MDKALTENYIALLREELIPAMGCTEPIALAYGASIARQVLGQLPRRTRVVVSGNIIKNVKSVIVPHTGGMRGIEAAVAAGLVAGAAEDGLEVLSRISEEQVEAIGAYYEEAEITVEQSSSDRVFEIDLTAEAEGHAARVWITDHHTHVARVSRDEETLYQGDLPCSEASAADRSQLSVERIVEFAETADLEPVKELLDRQIEYNTAIAKEGLTGKYGAGIGRVLMLSYGDNVSNRAKAWAAAGSDARMNGCPMPVVINSGSGNQGITVSVPVVIYAEDLKLPREKLLRALVVANLIAVHQKNYIGSLSAYCGVVSAACGAACGICYMLDHPRSVLRDTITNTIATVGGMVCDGAKSSCAAKISTALQTALLGMKMGVRNCAFKPGEGMVKEDVEETISNIGRMGRVGMKATDNEILNIMLGN